MLSLTGKATSSCCVEIAFLLQTKFHTKELAARWLLKEKQMHPGRKPNRSIRRSESELQLLRQGQDRSDVPGENAREKVVYDLAHATGSWYNPSPGKRLKLSRKDVHCIDN